MPPAALHPLELTLIQRLAASAAKCSASYASSDDRAEVKALAGLVAAHFGTPEPAVVSPAALTVVEGGAA